MPQLAPGFLIFDQGCSLTNYLAVMREEESSGERVPELSGKAANVKMRRW